MKVTTLAALSLLGTGQALKWTITGCDPIVTEGVKKRVSDTKNHGLIGTELGTGWEADVSRFKNDLFGGDQTEVEAVEKAWGNFATIEDTPDDAIIPPLDDKGITIGKPDGITRNDGFVITCENPMRRRDAANSPNKRPFINHANRASSEAVENQRQRCADPKVGPNEAPKAITCPSAQINEGKLLAAREEWRVKGKKGPEPEQEAFLEEQKCYPSLIQLCRWFTDAIFYDKAEWRAESSTTPSNPDENSQHAGHALMPRDDDGDGDGDGDDDDDDDSEDEDSDLANKPSWNPYLSRYLKENEVDGVPDFYEPYFKYWDKQSFSKRYVDMTKIMMFSGSGTLHHEMFHTEMGGEANKGGPDEVYGWERVVVLTPKNNADSRGMYSAAVYAESVAVDVDGDGNFEL